MEPLKITHFGRYQVLAEVGRGAMGIVYKARDPQIDRLVAVKTVALLNQGSEEEQEFRKRFFLEARAAGRLSHPGIVTIFDVGEEPSTHTPFIVMEYVAGESLSSILADRHGKVPLRTALELTLDLAEALDYAHSQGVVHRDIKPANILVTEDGHAKITDFGVAKLNLALTTVPGHVLGTPAYMSPEQLEGQELDGRSDLFSLGVILYSMITGHRPFQGNSATTVCFKVANREPLPASAYDAAFPPELDYVIARSMSKDRDSRYQTGREMALDLSSLLRGQAPRSQGDTTPSEGDQQNLQPPALSTVAREMAAIRAASAQTSQRRFANIFSPAHLLGTLRQAGPSILIASSIAVLLMSAVWFARQKPYTAPATPPASSTDVAASKPPLLKNTPLAPASIGKTAVHVATPKPQKRAVIAEVKPVQPPVETSLLQLHLQHHLKSGTVSVWSDGKLLYSHELHGDSTKKLVVFHGVQGMSSADLHLASGQHKLRVRVQSPETSYDQAAEIEANLRKDSEQVLNVKCDKQRLSLTMQ